jgi:Spy/CpxP family protein refolding chaperone
MRVTPAERTERLTKELALNGEQRERVLAIFTAADEKMQTAFKNRSGDRRAMRTTMQEIRKETEAGMQGVLTPEQFTRWQQQRERAPRGGKIPPPHN